MAVRTLTEPGECVLIQPPVYYPFSSVVQSNGRMLVKSELVYQNGRYAIDFEDFERKIADNYVRLFILCSPHNPVGRVWTEAELRRIGEICRRHGVNVVSDEIHCDFAFPQHPHHVFVKAVPEMLDRTIVCTAPSKTFNLAGLQVSNIWIPNEHIRKRFTQEMGRCGYFLLNALGLTACQAAYESGGAWLEDCRTYMRENLDYLRSFLRDRIPKIRLVEPEGTYFAWLDCSALNLEREKLNDLITNRAKLWLDAGHIFGGHADQFQRVVLACPRSVLLQALERLEAAVLECLEPDKPPLSSTEDNRESMSNRKTIPLSVMVTAIEETFDGWEQYYNTVTGEVEGIPDQNNYYVDRYEFQEVMEKIDESEDYLRLPSQRELHEYDIMERFALEHNSEPLLRALRGRRPFRTFKDRAAQIGLIKAYYAFRSAAYVEIAREWCRENAVPFTE